MGESHKVLCDGNSVVSAIRDRGIDIPAWVLIGGSIVDGCAYCVEESDRVAQAPQWLLEFCRKAGR